MELFINYYGYRAFELRTALRGPHKLSAVHLQLRVSVRGIDLHRVRYQLEPRVAKTCRWQIDRHQARALQDPRGTSP